MSTSCYYDKIVYLYYNILCVLYGREVEGGCIYQNDKMLDGYFLRKVKKRIRISYDKKINFSNV